MVILEDEAMIAVLFSEVLAGLGHDVCAVTRTEDEAVAAAFQFMPEKFTLTQLQRTYEIVLGRPLDKRNFRKKVLSSGGVKETDELHLQGRHRPARLYQFDLEARDF